LPTFPAPTICTGSSRAWPQAATDFRAAQGRRSIQIIVPAVVPWFLNGNRSPGAPARKTADEGIPPSLGSTPFTVQAFIRLYEEPGNGADEGNARRNGEGIIPAKL